MDYFITLFLYLFLSHLSTYLIYLFLLSFLCCTSSHSDIGYSGSRIRTLASPDQLIGAATLPGWTYAFILLRTFTAEDRLMIYLWRYRGRLLLPRLFTIPGAAFTLHVFTFNAGDLPFISETTLPRQFSFLLYISTFTDDRSFFFFFVFIFICDVFALFLYSSFNE